MLLTVLIMGAICYGILAIAERSKDPIRLGLQDYLTQITGGRAEITNLFEVQLVPDTLFKMGGIVIWDKDDPKKTLGKVETAYVALPFWHLLFGISQYYGFELKGFEAASGTLAPKKLALDFVGISAPEGQTSPAFLLEGRYNDLPLLVTVEMIRKKGSNPPLFSFAKTFSATLKLGGLEGSGILLREFSNVRMERGRLSRGEHTAEFTLEGIDKTPMDIKVKGTIDGINFNADLTKSGEAVRLDITPAGSAPEGIARIKDFIKKVESDLGLSEKDSELVITVKE